MTKRKPTKHEDDVLRNIRQPDRYDPKARSIGGPWRMVKCKDGAYVCYEQHLEIIDNLRKNAEINATQSPHDGIHTCSKMCKKPGCNRGLRDTIEEQDAQIEALKKDLKEYAADHRRVCRERIHDINLIQSLKEDNESLAGQVRQFEEHRDTADQIIKRLEAEVEALMTNPTSRLLRAEQDEVKRIKAEVERLTNENGNNSVMKEEWYLKCMSARAEVERLTQNTDKLCKHGDLQIERLKAEVERFKFTLEEERQITRQDWAGLRCEHDRVKRALEQAEAEVERLRASSFVTAVPIEQYERVIEAGDAMAREICILGPVDDKEKKAIDAWNAAKEGNPSV